MVSAIVSQLTRNVKLSRIEKLYRSAMSSNGLDEVSRRERIMVDELNLLGTRGDEVKGDTVAARKSNQSILREVQHDTLRLPGHRVLHPLFRKVP